MTTPRQLNTLAHEEICLIKGLARHTGLSQQEIIAHFSHPSRTVHHNLVSEIARGIVCGSDTAYPPASPDACAFFVARTQDGFGDEFLLSLVTMGSHHWSATEPLGFAYHYHPVGQGIFCSGKLTRPHRPPFRWVYDCGTEAGRRSPKRGDHVRREIASLAAEQGPDGVPHLDLVTLSHFDEDHLSGILDLIDSFTIGTLLLPYLTPWQRLLVALAEGAAIGDDLFEFLIAPTAFLLGRADGRIERILLVPAAGDGPALPPLIGPDEPPPEEPDIEGARDLWVKADPAGGEGQADAAGPDSGMNDARVEMLAEGGTITLGRVWEFVPYNDARFAGLADARFRAAAQPLADKLRHSVPEAEREEALDELIALYDGTFKSKPAKISAYRRNVISLFLYAGPIGRVALVHAEESVPRHRIAPLALAPYRFWEADRFGQIFTGDGYLKTPAQWDAFARFYGASRLHRGGIVQVMHHGSKANWHKGLAAKLAPQASLFCSDPAGKLGHPDWDVLDDFRNHRPQQVDLLHGWSFSGRFRFL